MNSVNLARTLLTPKVSKTGHRHIFEVNTSLAKQFAQDDASLLDLIQYRRLAPYVSPNFHQYVENDVNDNFWCRNLDFV